MNITLMCIDGFDAFLNYAISRQITETATRWSLPIIYGIHLVWMYINSVGLFRTNYWYVYNLVFHNFRDDNVKMYVWDDTAASRDAQEITSCILMHMADITTQKHLIAHSDPDLGQNGNIKVALRWIKITQSSNTNIETID